MASRLICQDCGIEADTRHVDFYQNIGMLVMRTHRRVNANLCKKCVGKHFWKMTGTTLFLGPWGLISLVVTPIFLVNNIARYLGTLGMPAVPPGATRPVLDDKIAAIIQPHFSKIVDCLNLGEKLDDVAVDIAGKTGVTPGQVLKYVIVRTQQNRQQPPTGGFPVIPKAPPKLPQTVIPLEPAPTMDIPNVQAIPMLSPADKPVIGISDMSPPAPTRNRTH